MRTVTPRAAMMCACASSAAVREAATGASDEEKFHDAREAFASDDEGSPTPRWRRSRAGSEARGAVCTSADVDGGATTRALTGAQPREDWEERDADVHGELERASREMEMESRGSVMARARAFAKASARLAKTMLGGRSVDLTSFLGTPIRWCARMSVLQITTDAESSLGKDVVPRTVRFLETLRSAREATSARERACRVALAILADGEPPASLRKPLNPILGETTSHSVEFPRTNERFESTWEQVSHHPPNSASSQTGPGVRIVSEVRPSPRLVGAHIDVELVGYIEITLTERNETYVSDIPSFEWRFLPRWHARMKRKVKSQIRCEASGYRVEFSYGSSRSVKGLVYGPDGAIEATINGRYDGKIVAESKRDRSVIAAYDFAQTKSIRAHVVRHTHLEDEFDTEVVWRDCFAAMDANKWDDARAAKRSVEERERAKRRERKASGQKFTPRFFDYDARVGRWVRNSRARTT